MPQARILSSWQDPANRRHIILSVSFVHFHRTHTRIPSFIPKIIHPFAIDVNPLHKFLLLKTHFCSNVQIFHRCFVQVDLYFYGITYLFRSFLYFRRFSVCFSQPYHTNMAYCFLRYAQAFLPVAEALLSIFSIFHDMVTFCI